MLDTYRKNLEVCKRACTAESASIGTCANPGMEADTSARNLASDESDDEASTSSRY